MATNFQDSARCAGFCHFRKRSQFSWKASDLKEMVARLQSKCRIRLMLPCVSWFYQDSMVKSMFQSAESKFLKAGMTLGEWLLADTSDLRSHLQSTIELYPCANPVPVTGGITLSHELLGVLNTWGETKTTQPSADLNLRVKSRIHKWMTQVWQYDQKLFGSGNCLAQNYFHLHLIGLVY